MLSSSASIPEAAIDELSSDDNRQEEEEEEEEDPSRKRRRIRQTDVSFSSSSFSCSSPLGKRQDLEGL